MKDETNGCQCGSEHAQERLLNQNEVAEILSVSPKTLEYWRWKGVGPEYVKMGRLARYRDSSIRKYIEKLTY